MPTPGFASGAGGSPEISSPLPAPRSCSRSAAGRRLPARALRLCSFHPSSRRDRAAPLPPAAKELLHSHASHPFLGEKASQQPTLDPASTWWTPVQPGSRLLPSLPANATGRAGDTWPPHFQAAHAWLEQPLTWPCRASPGPAVHVKQNKEPGDKARKCC